MVPSNLPKTKEEAAKQGSLSYFTGVACKNGHTQRHTQRQTQRQTHRQKLDIK